jgi:hypothetical protein
MIWVKGVITAAASAATQSAFDHWTFSSLFSRAEEETDGFCP